jgi:endo-1,4-beta-xylanase
MIAVSAVTITSCKKKTEVIDEYATTDTTGVLKQVADIPIGVGVRADLMANNPAYANLVTTHFNSITFENELKHASVVSNEGNYDYIKADAAVALGQSAGLRMFGHTLVDWQSTNSVYLRSLTAAAGSQVNVVPNPGFELGTGNNFSNWVTQVDPSATATWQAETASTHEGTRAMKVNVVTPGQYQYSIQAYSDLFSLTPGSVYTLTFYAKADVNSSRFKAIIQNTTYQEKTFFLTPTWQQYSFTFTANEANSTVRFHFPSAGTFYFDNVSILKPLSGENNLDPTKIENAMKQFITTSINRYKNRIHAWDVVNEPLAPGGAIRTAQAGENSTNFYFADVLGRSYIAKAFQYANTADPSATLFLNEGMLETDGAKVDSLVKLVNELKAQGVPIHGIGIQMHITTRVDRGGIENALKKLSATGLKIHVSEMDVRTNPWNYFGYRQSNEDMIAQRDLYRFVVGAYYRIVPAAQRFGITFWDPTDKYSWIIINQNKEDAPTLFDVNMQKKPAYYGVIVGLRRRS